MILDDTTNLKVVDIVTVQCDRCHTTFQRSLKSIAQRRKRSTGQDCCAQCARLQGASKRSQNTSSFLDQFRKSEAYYAGIKNRPSIAGELNRNWGKQLPAETRAKMSKSRTGKIGPKATAWKGGKLSFNHRIKSAVQTRWRWFSRVIERDKQCVHCGCTKQLDAHHIVPISTIIKQILVTCTHLDDTHRYEYVVNHPSIQDNELSNGKTLCRPCHKQEHSNWGSHEPKICKR